MKTKEINKLIIKVDPSSKVLSVESQIELIEFFSELCAHTQTLPIEVFDMGVKTILRDFLAYENEKEEKDENKRTN